MNQKQDCEMPEKQGFLVSLEQHQAAECAKSIEGKYIFVTTCVDTYLNGSHGEAIHEMKDRGEPLDWEDLVRAIGMEHLASVFPDAADLKDDFGVNWLRSLWRGIPCVYVVHSGIEHIFTLNGQIPESEYVPEDQDD
jgi:hypothetical protein